MLDYHVLCLQKFPNSAGFCLSTVASMSLNNQGAVLTVVFAASTARSSIGTGNRRKLNICR